MGEKDFYMDELFRNITVQSRVIKKTAKHIEIVASANPRMSAMALKSQQAVYKTLSAEYTEVNITHIDTMADLQALVAKKPDLVVLGMQLILLDPTVSYEKSPKIWLAQYLTAHGINFTGSTAQALMLEFNKPEAKQIVIDAGLKSAAYMIAPVGQPLAKHSLQFPLFVKPANRASSKGIDEMSVVYADAELAAKVRVIHTEYGADALIEEYLPGREFSVAVIRQPRSNMLRAMPIEISSPADVNGNAFLSRAVKVSDSEEVLRVTDQVLKNALNALAIGVFKALGARDYGRIDMRLDITGKPCFIEANLMPGLSRHGYLLRCFTMLNRTSYEHMILSIVRLAFERRLTPRKTLAGTQSV